MNSQLIAEQWTAYMAANKGNIAPLSNTEPFAVLFAKEEVRIDEETGRFFLPTIGWIDQTELPDLAAYDWIAMVEDGEGSSFILGEGSPFADEMIDVLPSIDGVIRAIPASISDFAANYLQSMSAPRSWVFH
jgi:hypothetical protein